MNELVKAVLLFFSALFPIVNPVGGSPIFLSMTSHCPANVRHGLSRTISINSFLLLVGSYLIGSHILAFFGISIPVVQIGGGIVVLSTGWAMLHHGTGSDAAETPRNASGKLPAHEAFYPLTLPLTVGPGSISVAITLGANATHPHHANLPAIIGAVIASALIGVSVYLCYRFADRLASAIGPTAMSVILRLYSFLLFCIGVQIFWNGLTTLITALPAFTALHRSL